MKNNIDRSSVETTLDKVCQSSGFASSHRNVRLLRFLVRLALEGEDVKEQVIGMELFSKSYDPSKSDGKVRVYMFYLRKKLKEYYAKEGRDDAIVFVLEKGQYNLSFGTSQDINIQEQVIILPKMPVLIGGSLAVLIILALAFSDYIFVQKVYCWQPFFDAGDNNRLIVADHYMVQHKEEGRRIKMSASIRGVYNDQDFAEYLKAHPEEPFTVANFTFLSKMAPYAIHQLSRWFFAHQSDFAIGLESEFDFENIRNSNYIYIGQAKTMNASKALFLKNSNMFSVEYDGFIIHRDGRDSLFASNPIDADFEEFVMVSYTQLVGNNRALFFVSDHDIGVMSTVRRFTDPVWLENFYDQMPTASSHFNALFVVRGVRRNDMSCELIALETL